VEGAPNLQIRSCTECGFDDARTTPTSQSGADNDCVWIVVAIAGVAAVGVVIFLVMKKKK
jgi:hypothetical protein